MEQKNDLNKTLLYAVIGLSAVVLLGIGVLIGVLASPRGTTNEAATENVIDDADAEQLEENTLNASEAMQQAEEPTSEELEAKLKEELAAAEAARIAAEAAQKEAEAAKAAAKTESVREKTYGFYPSFYVKKTSYTVSHEDAMHPIAIYTDRNTKIKRAWTDSRWLEEEDIDDGDYRFHVKENDDDDPRSGKLFIKDDKGRIITIFVTQRGER